MTFSDTNALLPLLAELGWDVSFHAQEERLVVCISDGEGLGVVHHLEWIRIELCYFDLIADTLEKLVHQLQERQDLRQRQEE